MKSLWFTAMTGGIIGIVKSESGKIYIGVGRGHDEEEDEAFIAKYGAPLHLDILLRQFKD